MSQLISVNIRPHLISFLFQELEGDNKAMYGSKKVKLANVTTRSSLGRLLHLFKSRAVSQQASDKILGFSVFLSIDSDDADKTSVLLNERNYSKNQKELQLLPEDVKLLNDHLENIYRIALTEFVKGYVKNNDSYSKVSEAIHEFMLAHNLYDSVVDPESLRRLYYTSVKKNRILYRLQVPTSNQITHYNLVS